MTELLAILGLGAACVGWGLLRLRGGSGSSCGDCGGCRHDSRD